MKHTLIRLCAAALALMLCLSCLGPVSFAADEPYWGSSSDNGDGTFDNDACVDSDTPDPDIIRVGDAYYMTSTSMHFCPGVPIMKSYDLVNWKVVSYVYNVLDDYDQLAMRSGRYDYGKGSWATSLRYREYDKKFYLSHTCNTTNKTYFYRTDDIENGTWEQFSVCNTFYHDGSMLFEGEDIYMFSGSGTISVDKLKPDFSGSEWKKSIITGQMTSDVCGRNNTFLEATHAYKVGDTYYVFMCTWPSGAGKQQLVWKSKTVDGPYEGKVIIDDSYGRSEGLAQGGIVDMVDGSTQTEGKWMGFFMHLRGAAGRGLALTPCTFDADGWPVVANASGKASRSDRAAVPVEGTFAKESIVESTEFDNGETRPAWTLQAPPKNAVEPERYAYNGSNLPLGFEWNHMPDNRYWSMTERAGYLRLTNGTTATSMTDCRNVLTARTFGPQCWGHVAMEIDGMRDGDIAGFGAFHRSYGYLAVRVEGDKKYIVYRQRNGDSQDASFSNNDPWIEDVLEELDPGTSRVYFKTWFDYRTYRNEYAHFYYSTDSVNWIDPGKSRKVEFGYPTHFDGCRFGIFNFATKQAGGYVDFDYFALGDTEMKDDPSDHAHNYVDEVTAPGCLEGGYTTATCSICGRSYKHDYTDALGHDWDDGSVILEPTEEGPGYMIFTCARCGETRVKKIPRYGPHLQNSIDFSKPSPDYEIIGETAARPTPTGLEIKATRNAVEPCNDQNSGDQANTPEDLIRIPLTSTMPWTATLEFDFDPTANNGYYQFFGFYAADGEDYQNMCGIRGGDGALQNFLRVDGAVTADSDDLNSTPGLSAAGTYWFRIEQLGDGAYACYRSSDGENFTEMFRYEDTGIEGEYLIIDAYTGMTEGYTFTLKSLSFGAADGAHADMTELVKAIAGAQGLDRSKYTGETLAELDRAVEAARAVLVNEDAAQDEVDAAAQAVTDAIDALEEKPAFLFDDVKDEGKFYYDPVYWAYYAEPQITNGLTATTFGPDAGCTRAQVVTFLWRAAGCPTISLNIPEGEDSPMPFTDVDGGSYYFNAVLWAKLTHITEGTTATTFSPNATCTRGQIVTFLWRFKGQQAPKSTDTPFTDLKPNGFYKDAVAWAVENSITNGMSATAFGPDATCTRGQVVTFLQRAAGA